MFDESSWLNRIATAAIIGLLGWNLLTTQRLSIDVAVATEQIAGLNSAFQLTTNDRFTEAEATAKFALTEQRIERLENWNQNLSERLRILEGELRDLKRNGGTTSR